PDRLAAGLGLDPAAWAPAIEHLIRAGLIRRAPAGLNLVLYERHGNALAGDLERRRAAKRDRQSRWRKRAKRGEVGTTPTKSTKQSRTASSSASSSTPARTAPTADLEAHDLCIRIAGALAEREG